MNHRIHQTAVLLIVMLAFALVSACGGGGGNSGTTVPSSPVAIDTNNAGTAAGTSAGNVTSTYEVGVLGTGLALGAATQQQRHFRLLPFARKQLKWLQESNMSPVSPTAAGLSISLDLPCDGSIGTVKITLNDSNGDNIISAGDSFTLFFTNCFDNLDQSTTNGSMTLTLNQLTGNPDTDTAWTSGITVTLSNLAVSDDSGNFSLNGDFTLTTTTANSIFFTGSITGNSLAISENGDSEILSAYDIAFTSDEAGLGTAYTIDANGTVASTKLDGSVQFQTMTTFEGTEPDYPHTGVMRISGAQNSYVILTAIDSTDVRLEIDVDGDSTIDQTVVTQWALIDD